MDIDKILKKVLDDKNKEGQDKEKITSSGSSASGHGLAASFEANEINKMLSLCKELDIPILNLSKYKIPTEVLKLIPENLARTYKVIPVARFGLALTLGVSDPFDIVAIDDIKNITKLDIQLVLGTPSQIFAAIDEYYAALNLAKKSAAEKGAHVAKEGYGVKETYDMKESDSEEDFAEIDTADIKEIAELSQKKQIVETVNNILVQGLKQRASDIHLEPFSDTLRLRYRVDGVLRESKFILKKKYEPAIIARIKIMSELDITQRRLPQDGRISIRLDAREVDLRVSIIPVSYGEKIVLRILEKGSLQIDLERLGFSEYPLEAFKKSAARPHGMLIITGPTGSGKSTTLYALLNRLNDIAKNILTIEDPVEYQMKGITQIQVKPDIGLTFANVLRSSLRQSPDIVMVGEMRDFETADIAIKSALTGHIILSTLHTNDAPTAIVRLMNMGIEPFLIASVLALVAAQRLCRKVCPQCKEPYEIATGDFSGLPADFKDKKVTFYRGKGCQNCNNTGYFGRVAVVEALVIDDTLRQMILERRSLTAIREYARGQGMKSLREDAIAKCLSGEISLEEAVRVTPEG